MPGIPDKITGKTQWTCDVTLPGMLHARMVRPATLGSTLISVGALDKKLFPTAEVVSKGNLVAVVSPNEWEAIRAAQSVATSTKWTDWSGFSGSEDLTKALRAYKWGAPSESRGKATDVIAALAAAPKTITATYGQHYARHAPIGPLYAVADVRSDGSVTVWTHSAQSQGLRAQIANTLNTPVEKVVVRWLEHSGQYGRTTLGGDGAEGDAVILSQLTGKPVRVQWTLEEDMAWSTVSPGWVSDMKAGLDANGRVAAGHRASYSPHMFDARLLGAILAGMPCSTSNAGGWEARPSPLPTGRKIGNGSMTGRGVGIIVRSNGYWAGIAEVAVTPGTGAVRVTKFTIGLECGKIINPRQLDRCMKSGLIMGLSEALKEEVTFDTGKVTSTDWSRYKILTMEAMPEITIVQISRDANGFRPVAEPPHAAGPPP